MKRLIAACSPIYRVCSLLKIMINFLPYFAATAKSGGHSVTRTPDQDSEFLPIYPIEKILRILHSITSNKKSRVDRRSCDPARSPFFRAGPYIKDYFSIKITISFSVSSRENGRPECIIVSGHPIDFVFTHTVLLTGDRNARFHDRRNRLRGHGAIPAACGTRS